MMVRGWEGGCKHTRKQFIERVRLQISFSFKSHEDFLEENDFVHEQLQ